MLMLQVDPMFKQHNDKASLQDPTPIETPCPHTSKSTSPSTHTTKQVCVTVSTFIHNLILNPSTDISSILENYANACWIYDLNFTRILQELCVDTGVSLGALLGDYLC